LEHLENKGKTKKKNPFPLPKKGQKLDPSSCVHPEPFYWLHDTFISKTVVDTILGLQGHKL
jgi:hypothetical protein